MAWFGRSRRSRTFLTPSRRSIGVKSSISQVTEQGVAFRGNLRYRPCTPTKEE